MAKQKNRKPARGADPVPAGTAFLDRFRGGPWRWVAFAAALWVILAVLYPGPVFEGHVFGAADTQNANAFDAVGNRALADGEYPFWNPYLFAGMPTFGSLAYVRFLYPPTEVFNFLQNRMGFVPLSWMLGHLLFGGLGMVWLLGRWRLPVAALLLGAAAWLLMPKVVAWGVHGHGSKLVAAMYLPWLVGWTLRVLDGRGTRAIGMVGLLLGMQFLAGHVQITFYTLMATGWLALWRTVWPDPDAPGAALRWKRFGLWAAGIALGFGLAAIMLVPVHGYAGLSIRGQDTAGGGGVGLDYATGWSLAPAETGTLVLPSAAGFGKATYQGLMPFTDYPNYFGFLMLALAAAAFLEPRGRRTALALLVMAFLALLISFGGFGFGFYELLYRTLPYFNKFRIPSMILVLTGFALAVLASRGASRLREEPVLGTRPWLGPAALAGLGLILLLGGVTGAGRGPFAAGIESLAAQGGRQVVPLLVEEAWLLHKADLVRIGLILLTGAGALFYAARNAAFRRRGLVWVFALLIGVDLLAVAGRITHPENSLQQVGRDSSGRARLMTATRLEHDYVPADEAGPGPAAAELAAAVGHGRVWPLDAGSGQNGWMADGIRSLGGYHPAKLASFEPIRKRLFSTRPAGRLATWLGARVVTYDAPFNAPELETLAGLGADIVPGPIHRGPPVLHAMRSPLPRARLLGEWRLVDSLPQKDELEPFLDALQDGAIDFRRVVHLDREPAPLPAAAAGPLPDPVFVSDGLDEIVLETAAPTPALLLLADMMAPGWSVTVDGEPAELLTADLVLRAVALGPGEHTVVFRYRDPAVRRGLALSLASLAVTAGLLGLPSVLRRRGRRAQEAANDV